MFTEFAIYRKGNFPQSSIRKYDQLRPKIDAGL